MYLFNNKKIKKLEEEIDKIRKEQIDFLTEAHKIMQCVLDNDKRKFMYEIRKEDMKLIEDGKKYRAIRKIII